MKQNPPVKVILLDELETTSGTYAPFVTVSQREVVFQAAPARTAKRGPQAKLQTLSCSLYCSAARRLQSAARRPLPAQTSQRALEKAHKS